MSDSNHENNRKSTNRYKNLSIYLNFLKADIAHFLGAREFRYIQELLKFETFDEIAQNTGNFNSRQSIQHYFSIHKKEAK